LSRGGRRTSVARARAARRGCRVVHRRTDRLAAHGCSRQFGLRPRRLGGVRQRGQDGATRRGSRMIEVHGAVSEPVARALAQGCRKLAGTDYGLGVTGIAGPGGGSPEKPVGTVYVALAGPGERVRVRHLKLPGERDRVKFQASQAALDLLRRALLD
ncbi:CinA-like protein, partial [Geodia barretti]